MTILYGDARSMPFEDEQFQTVITSPPYYSLRRYGDSDLEIGVGDLDDYIADIVKVGEEVWRVLNERGIFWLNIGDTASGSGGAGGDYNRGGTKEGQPPYRQGKTGIPPMQWCLIPERVSIALQEAGWLVRSKITWNKGRLRPESLDHVRRPGVSSETILMLVKHRKYEFYADRFQFFEQKGDVWSFPPQTAKSRSHLAPFPETLPERCILLSTMKGDSVLDPFVGSGTTVEVAERMERQGFGLDLYKFEDA